jgi:archaellum biogenesis ATPase FlaH
MVKLIVGGKGSGKTKRLVDDLNLQAQNPEANIILLVRGDRLHEYVRHPIRVIDMSEYPVNNYDELLAFIAGLDAKDFDISHVYIDSISKVANVDDEEALAKFLPALEGFSKEKNFEVEIMYSVEPENLDERIKAYV